MKAAVVVTALSIAMLSVSNAADADTTTGFTFSLSNGTTLHDVYVGVADGSMNPLIDVYLPSGTTLINANANISPPGFSVPTGASGINLTGLYLGLGSVSAANPPTRWAMIGLVTNSGVDHLVYATSQDLTGVDFSTPIIGGCSGGCTEASLVNVVKTGQTGPQDDGLLFGMIQPMAKNGYMRPFGQTAQLFYFSGGVALGGSVTANALGTPIQDTDGDGVPDAVDNCPTVANGPAQAGVSGVGNQTDTDGDAVGDACDNCVSSSNPRVAPDVATYLAANQWATLTGGQRDDDHDGYGNKCDAKFPGTLGAAVGASDLAQFRASNGKSRTGDTCGTGGTHPCAIFDLDEGAAAAIGAPDLAQFRTLNGKVPGPKCPTCPLLCQAGTAGTCGPIP